MAYYPFGMSHVISRSVVTSTNPGQKIKYQGQERQNDLDLNWDSFKFRNYHYAIGRFMSVDPLAEKFQYNSVYAFQENKLGMGHELEGLELSAQLSKDGKSINVTYRFNPVNNTKLSDADFNCFVAANVAATTKMFNGQTAEGLTVKTTMIRDAKATIKWEYQTDHLDVPIEGEQWNLGHTAKIGDTQKNRVQINVYGHIGTDGKLIPNPEGDTEMAETGAHENGHVVGGNHVFEFANSVKVEQEIEKDPNNMMRNGTNMGPNQRSKMIKLIEEQQPKL